MKRECVEYAAATRDFCRIDWRVTENTAHNNTDENPGKEIGEVASDCNSKMLQLRELVNSLHQLRVGQDEKQAQMVLSNLLR